MTARLALSDEDPLVLEGIEDESVAEGDVISLVDAIDEGEDAAALDAVARLKGYDDWSEYSANMPVLPNE